jgi:hypothetical protein
MRRRFSEVLVRGAIGGSLAGAVVASWFFIVDIAAGDPLSTPAALGEATVGGVAVYTVIHFIVFGLLGVGATLIFQRLGMTPGPTKGALFGLFIFTAIIHGGLRLMDAWALVDLPVAHVLVANTVAGMVMGVYLQRARRVAVPAGPESGSESGRSEEAAG